jgi:glucose/mannose-6-phosphate isomerase
LNKTTLRKYDSQKMYEVYDRWPEIAYESYQLDLEKIGHLEISHIVFAGMGGSGALGDIFSAILSKSSIHVDVVKGYHLPNTTNSKTLVVTTSVSGNTAETLSVLNSATKSTCKIIAFSNDGKMLAYCKKNRIGYRHIPMYHSPRASFPAFLYSMLKVLKPVLPFKDSDVEKSLSELQDIKKQIFSDNLKENNPSLQLAEWIKGIPLIYYPWGLQAAAIRFKNSLQENAKLHATAEDVMEACHNGIVAWSKPSIVRPILLEGHDDYIKTKERWEILREFFSTNNISFKEVKSIKGSILSKLITLIYLLDYASIYRAVLSKIDPSPVENIDYIKNKL